MSSSPSASSVPTPSTSAEMRTQLLRKQKAIVEKCSKLNVSNLDINKDQWNHYDQWVHEYEKNHIKLITIAKRKDKYEELHDTMQNYNDNINRKRLKTSTSSSPSAPSAVASTSSASASTSSASASTSSASASTSSASASTSSASASTPSSSTPSSSTPSSSTPSSSIPSSSTPSSSTPSSSIPSSSTPSSSIPSSSTPSSSTKNLPTIEKTIAGKNKRKLITEETYTVKSGILGFLKTSPNKELIFNRIQDDVEEMSRLNYEAAILISFDVMKRLADVDDNVTKDINFLHYYYMLLDKKKQEYMDPEYKSWRTIENELEDKLYDKKQRSNLFVELANKYRTNFEKNIWMHGYSRVRKYLKNINNLYHNAANKPTNNDIKLALDFFFREKSVDKIPSKVIVPEKWKKKQGLFAKLHLKDDIYQFLPEFYMIWAENKNNNWKNFRLTPLNRLGRVHLSYDTTALYQLLCSIKICPKIPSTKKEGTMNNMSAAEFHKDPKYSDYFNLLKKKRYSGSFSTDGVAVSVRYLREKRDEDLQTTPNLQHLKDSPSQVYVGIDPGMRLFLGGVRMVGKQTEADNIEKIKYKSATYYHDCGYKFRTKKLKTWTRLQQEIESNRPLVQTWNNYLKFQLDHMVKLQAIYLQRKITRHRFDQFIRRSETIDKVIKDKIINESPEKVVVFFGSSTQSGNCPMKGYMRSPHKLLVQRLKMHPKITYVPIDEYNTTKVCSSCLSKDEHTISKSPHRYSLCKKCNIVWNRDVNAGKNIFQIGYNKLVENDHTFSIRVLG